MIRSKLAWVRARMAASASCARSRRACSRASSSATSRSRRRPWGASRSVRHAEEMSDEPTLTLMTVHAHPDDESNSTGGTLARYSAEGVRTVLVTCTNGEYGDAPGHIKPGEEGHDPEDVARIRLQELEIATTALGVTHVETLGYRDSGMQGWPGNDHPDAFHAQPDDVVTARLVELMERYQPQVVVTYFGNSGYNHPDHLKAHDITQRAVKESGIPQKLYLIARPRSWRDRMRTIAEEHGIEMPFPPAPPAPDPDAKASEETPPPRPFGVDDDAITTYIDASAYAMQKKAALGAHLSQLEGSFFLRFPDEVYGEVFGHETFIREVDSTDAPLPEDDLFAGLR